MSQILSAIYIVLFFSYILMGLFVVFHIFRYSLKKNYAVFGITLFLSVFTLLLITNFLLFLSLPFDQLIPNLSF
ncbi:MAG: hypothetical protein PHH40_03970 [Candidatus Moranbacteria bacterium]|nr:hypothetical protein [Candidatus Moranbacteria bacterium]MDD3964603.1 hypothetical protein [Candidatus Moranbacteria bacterium]